MLRYELTQKYGDQIVMVAPQTPYVQLPTPNHGARFFPQENKTETPRFNDMRPNPGVEERNETPRKDNMYNNGYDSSRNILEDRTFEPNIGKWFDPPINFQK